MSSSRPEPKPGARLWNACALAVALAGLLAQATGAIAAETSSSPLSPDRFTLQGVMLADSAADLFDLEETDSEEDVTSGSADELFELDEAATSGSAEELFELDESTEATAAKPATATWWDKSFTGFWQNTLAYTYSDPEHFSTWKNHVRVATSGNFGAGVSWKASGDIIYDPIYDLDNFYPDAVEDNLDFTGYLYETYVDFTVSGWDLRVGNQLIVWGEAVGVFFADVVSGLDLRDFILPDFELVRLPQAGVRAEYFADDFYLEFIALPLVKVNEIGRFGGEFYTLQPPQLPAGISTRFAAESEPGKLGRDSAAGVRASYLTGGWDTSLFYYTSPDRTAAFERRLSLGPRPELTIRPVHERIHQFGSTLAKNASDAIIFKSEAVYTRDRLVTTTSLLDPDGLVESDELRYLLALDWGLEQQNVNLQFFQTWLMDHQKGVQQAEVESGFSIFWNTTAIHPNVEPEILWIRSLNRDEWLLQAKIDWRFVANWRATLGTDIFKGPVQGLFGRYDARDRVYAEIRFDF